jgi:hypothetical protein
LDNEGLILVVGLELPFVWGRLQHRLFANELTVVRTVGDSEETNVELRLPLDVHAVVNIFLSPLLD